MSVISKDFGFRDQIIRSALSIASNIAEGVERDSKKDFARFLQYLKASCGELRTQIYIGIDIDYIEPAVGKKWIQETKELSAMLVGLSKSLRKRNYNINMLLLTTDNDFLVFYYSFSGIRY